MLLSFLSRLELIKFDRFSNSKFSQKQRLYNEQIFVLFSRRIFTYIESPPSRGTPCIIYIRCRDLQTPEILIPISILKRAPWNRAINFRCGTLFLRMRGQTPCNTRGNCTEDRQECRCFIGHVTNDTLIMAYSIKWQLSCCFIVNFTCYLFERGRILCSVK